MSQLVNNKYFPLKYIQFLVCFLLVFSKHSGAEYRAYQYMLSPVNADQKNSTIMTTSLNPVAMTRYYGINKNRLYLLRTWICPGNTGGKKTCTPPYQTTNLENFLLEKSQGEL